MSHDPHGDAPPEIDISLTRVQAPNPGPFTLGGTNSYVLRHADRAWVVDPGPRDALHLAQLIHLSCTEGVRPSGILITHRHADHVEGAGTLRRQLENRAGHSVPLWAVDTDAIPAALPLPVAIHGDDGVIADVIHLPGHTSDSAGLLTRNGKMLVGDTLLGGSSTVIAEPDGNLADYLQSLTVLRVMALDGRISSLHPGHGDEYGDPLSALAAIDDALAHRTQRIEQVREARRQGALTVDRIVKVVYGPTLAPELLDAARSTVRATLRYITDRE